MNGTVAYVLMGFPRVSETFIASEIHRVEQAGVPLRLFVIKPVEAREQGHRHPVLDAIRAVPEHLPDPSSLTAPLHRWRRRDLRPFLPALRRCLRARPGGVARAFATAFGQACRDRRAPVCGPRKIYVKEFFQAVALADRVLAAGDVRHLHAHFAHGTTTIAWHAATIAGLPFSFTGHARDIYSTKLNRPAWLRRKLLAARFVVTCTEANVRHLRALAPGARVELVYHGLSADLTRLIAADGAPPARNGRLRILGVGRLVAKKGFDVLVDACAELAGSGVPFEALIVGQDDSESAALRRRIAARGLSGAIRLPGPLAPEALLAEYRRASALCMPCRLLDQDRDGIPNVLVEAMAAGAPVVATPVSGIPELVQDGVNGLLVPPEDPRALAGALLRLHGDAALTARLVEAGRETVRERFDGERLAGRLAALFREALV